MEMPRQQAAAGGVARGPARSLATLKAHGASFRVLHFSHAFN